MNSNIKKNLNLAIIPARGGSKRIPGKNIKLFWGKPIIAYAIQLARDSGLFDRIIVSTDDGEIAQIAGQWGAKVPFMRPKHLADDHATTIAVIQHAINWHKKNNQVFDHACCIYPTAPFARIKDLERGYELLTRTNVDFAFAVASFPSSVFRALTRISGNRLKMIWPEHQNTRTQDLPETFHDAGQFYWGKTGSFLKCKAIAGEDSSPVVIPRHLAQDIDTPEDWVQAELLYQTLFPEKCN